MNSPARRNREPRRLTIAQIARQALAAGRKSAQKGNEAFGFALRNFLDDFYAVPKREKTALVTEEPSKLRSTLRDGGVADAYLAALANHLAATYRIAKPEWSRTGGKRYPDKPWFALNTPEARVWLLTQSPAAFRERDLFISEDALSRA
jgi:hypothetical protein